MKKITKLGYILQYNKKYYLTRVNGKWCITDYAIDATMINTKEEAEEVAKILRMSLVNNNTIDVIEYRGE